MMMHTEFTTLMSSVLDHEAPPGDLQKLNEHVATCGACAHTWAQLRALDTMLYAAPVLAAPPNFVLGVTRRLEEQRLRKRRRRWLGSGLLVAWAGMIAVVWLGLLALTVWGYTHPSWLGQLAAAGAQTTSGVANWLVALRSAVEGLGLLPISLGIGFYLCLTALLSALWFWIMVRKSGWADALSLAHDASA